MSRIELTQAQQKDLIHIIMTGIPWLPDALAVELLGYNPALPGTDAEYHSIRYVMPTHGKDCSFLLNISGYGHDIGRNPERIDLFRIGSGTAPERRDLRGIGYMTDRLRKYGIW